MCYCGIDKTYIISTHFLFWNFFFGFIFYVAHLLLKQAVQSSDDQNCFTYIAVNFFSFWINQDGCRIMNDLVVKFITIRYA